MNKMPSFEGFITSSNIDEVTESQNNSKEVVRT